MFLEPEQLHSHSLYIHIKEIEGNIMTIFLKIMLYWAKKIPDINISRGIFHKDYIKY